MNDQSSGRAGFLGNPGREARRVQAELLRRLGLIGIGAEDGAAVRRLLGQDAPIGGGHWQAALVADVLGLGLVMGKLVHRTAAGGPGLSLEPATRALLETLQGRPASRDER